MFTDTILVLDGVLGCNTLILVRVDKYYTDHGQSVGGHTLIIGRVHSYYTDPRKSDMEQKFYLSQSSQITTLILERMLWSDTLRLC